MLTHCWRTPPVVLVHVSKAVQVRLRRLFLTAAAAAGAHHRQCRRRRRRHHRSLRSLVGDRGELARLDVSKHRRSELENHSIVQRQANVT